MDQVVFLIYSKNTVIDSKKQEWRTIYHYLLYKTVPFSLLGFFFAYIADRMYQSEWGYAQVKKKIMSHRQNNLESVWFDSGTGNGYGSQSSTWTLWVWFTEVVFFYSGPGTTNLHFKGGFDSDCMESLLAEHVSHITW